ncbi:MAG: phage portal protein [Chitinophagaceae bacterium]|nr:phage portal protein [Chitinophagaceae bacterium]
MNVVDKIVSFFSPDAGRKRMASRMALSAMNNSLRKFEAAAGGRRTEGWTSVNTSTNLDLIASLPRLRARSKDLVRNNGYARNGIGRIANNTVGTGIIPTPKNVSDSVYKKIMQAWEIWGEKLDCDFDGKLNFYGLQKMVMRTVAKSGECIIRRVRTKFKNGAIPLQLQVLEPDFIDSSRNTPQITGKGSYSVNGVEYDTDGKVKGYWLFSRHPLEWVTESKLVPAEDVIHVYDLEDPGQNRGIPFLTSSMLRIRDFDEYEDAQLLRQKIAACFSVFITENAALSPLNIEKQAESLERVEPGIIEHLPPGKSVQFASPPAAEGYDKYSQQVLRAISAGIGVSYEALTNDLSNVNFSSGRMGWIEFQRNIEHWQWLMLIPVFCDKAWDWFVEAATLAGFAKPGEIIPVNWTAPRREMIDPVKETQALSDQVRNGFVSWWDAVKSLGENPSEILAQLVKDAKAFDDAGLKPVCDPRFDTNRGNDLKWASKQGNQSDDNKED